MSIFDNVTFMNEADNNRITKADYLKKKQQRAEEEAHKYDKYDNYGYGPSSPDSIKGSRARSTVGSQASDKQTPERRSITKDKDQIRKKYVNNIIERDRLSREPAYNGKGIDKYFLHNTEHRKPDTNKDRPTYGDFYDDKDKRIAHNIARSTLDRHLRHHSESAGIFESVEII